MTRIAFPPDFRFGASTSAYQVEGAVHADGRGESIWDRFSHTPGRVANDDTGDVTSDHHTRWAEDVALLAELGLDGYRFSISWPRIQPDGRGAINERGAEGFRSRFGLVHVDYPTGRRLVKDSGRAYARIVAERGFEATDAELAGARERDSDS